MTSSIKLVDAHAFCVDLRSPPSTDGAAGDVMPKTCFMPGELA